MTTLFGVPTPILAGVLAGLTTTAAIIILLLAARNPILVKLGVRHIPRRRARSVLIVVGLALSTTIVAAAFTTGDALGNTVRSLVRGSLGNVDEVVVSYRGGTRRFAQSDFQGLADGRIPLVAGDDFAQSEVARVAALLDGTPGVAAVTGSIIRQYAIADTDQQVVNAGINLLALPPDTPPAFGALTDTACPTPEDATPAGQCALPLSALGEGDIYLNEAAAGNLQAKAGDNLVIYVKGREVPARVKAIARNGDIGGTQATALVGLPWWQTTEGIPGSINQVLIVNEPGEPSCRGLAALRCLWEGGAAEDSIRWSREIALRLRSNLVDDTAAQTIFRLLATPSVRQGLRDSINQQPPFVQQRVLDLAAALEQPGVTPEFKSLIGDPQILASLRPVLFRLAPGTATSFVNALTNLNRLTVIELKQLSLDIAGAFASALTSTFLVLGLFSIATGIMLVFLIFALLAAERRPELGMARALGTQRGHLVQIFLFEGALYDLAASIVGILAGLAVAVLIINTLSGYLTDFGLRLTGSVEPQSLMIAFCLGLLITFVTVSVSAWRIARLNVVTAVRNLPDEPKPAPSLADLARSGRPLAFAWGLVTRGPLLILFGAALALATNNRPTLVALNATGWSLAVIGVGLTVRWALVALGVTRVTRDRIGFTLAGTGLLLFWARGVPGFRISQTEQFVGSLELLALSGLFMVLGAVWAVAYNLELLPGLISGIAGLVRRGAPIAAGLRIAAAYPARYRWRTGLAILMFTLVIFTVTTASILLSGTRYAYADLETQAAGFDLRADVDPARIPDLRAAIANAPAVSPDDFTAIGGQSSIPVEAIQLGATVARWGASTLQVVDDGWLQGVGAPLTQRAPEYASDEAVWAALRTTPGLAVLQGSTLPRRDAPPRGNTTTFGTDPFVFQGMYRDDRGFTPTTIWLRDPKGGPPMKLTVIAVMDARASIGRGFYTTSDTVRAAGWTPPTPGTYYLKVAPGVVPHSAALGLGRALSATGGDAAVLNEELRVQQGIRLLLNQLLQGFMGLGLISGVVALGVIASRAVVERRQQIGVLRAIGFGRGLVQATFLLESTLIAVLGILIGVGLGIILSRNVVAFIAAQNPDVAFGIPWLQIGVIALVAYLMTVATTMLPAWQAGHVYPAEALRYE
ncbi:MAG: FtsX-like permease family protein [Anaerolineae bacterium]